MSERRYDLDWLRVIAFGVLVFFHAAITFVPGGLPLIQNVETSLALQWFVDYSHQFRLGLLFLVSGAGIGYARRRRNTAEFIRERTQRLMLPFVVGMLLVVPPMVYTEKVFLGEFTGNFLSFYPQFFDFVTHGVYPSGNFSWHHFWFIAYLYLYCLFGIRVFDWLDREEIEGRLRFWADGAGLYWLLAPLIVVEILLRAWFPGFRDLIHDWASFFHWFLLLSAGYCFARHPMLLDSAMQLRWYSLLIALVSTAGFFAFFYDDGFSLDPDQPAIVPVYLTYCVVRMIMIWSTTLTLIGMAARFLRFGHPVLTYLNEAVYPLFILHLTCLTVLGYFVVQWSMGVWGKYLILTGSTFVIVMLSYHWLIRPFNLVRRLFGVKPRQIPPTG